MAHGTLYLIPAPLGEGELAHILPEAVRQQAAGLRHFVVEQAKTARAYLKQLGVTVAIQELSIAELNEHTKPGEIDALLAPLLAGHDVGLLSEAGCPAIADPGALLVRRAHERGVRVMPLVGPSSILLALMASGANGQRFSFHGYLPVDAADRVRKLRELERRSSEFDEAVAFIETPYRNNQMLGTLLDTLKPATLLCAASELTTANEIIVSRRVGEWPKARPDLHKHPTVFVLYAGQDRRR